MVELFRLRAYVIKSSQDLLVPTAVIAPADLSFPTLDPSWKLDFDSLLSSFLLQLFLYAALGSKFLLAVFAFLIANVALVRRGSRMMLEYPYLKSFNLAARTPTVFCIVTLLLVLVWMPRGGLGDFTSIEENLRPASTHIVKSANAQATAQLVNSAVFPGVVIYPKDLKHTRVVAPRATNGEGIAKSDKPYVIPFDGVYWVWLPPYSRPPVTAILFNGTPAKLGFHSTDLSPLWMEAHQELATSVDLSCCSAIQVVIEDADPLPQTISIELVAGNIETPAGKTQPLGIQPVPATQQKQTDPPVEQTLTFSIPNHTVLQNVDELTVKFHLSLWRPSKSAKIAIKQFVLVPRQ
jgi:hypothetical protein